MSSSDWRDQALCRDLEPALFFPIGQGDNMIDARRVCSLCPVMAVCLEDALRVSDTYAFRGGTSGRQRETLLAARRKALRAAKAVA